MKRFLSVFTLLFVLIVSANAQDISSALRQADARFTSGNESGAIELVNKILAKYPSNKEAVALLDKFNTTIKKREIDADWKIATQTNTFEAYQQFRTKHPNSEYDCLASDNMAKRLADKFTPNSTYAERTQAESYAKKEMTKDYVKNKWNAAMAKKTTSSTSSYSSSSSNYTRSSYSSSSGYSNSSSSSSYRTGTSTSSSNSYSKANKTKEENVTIGIEGSLEGMQSFSYGLGLSLRLGRFNTPCNFTIGMKYQKSSISERVSYYNSYYDKYGWYDGYKSGYAKYIHKASQWVFPMIFNWNFSTNDYCNGYFGFGYEFGVVISEDEEYKNTSSYSEFDKYEYYKSDDYKEPIQLYLPSTAFIFQFGVTGRHWDWKAYYKLSTRNWTYYDGEMGVLGTAFTYYF